MTYMFYPVARSVLGGISSSCWPTGTVPSSMENKASWVMWPVCHFVRHTVITDIVTYLGEQPLEFSTTGLRVPFLFFFLPPSFVEHLWEQTVLCIVWLVIWEQQILSNSSFYGFGSKVSVGLCFVVCRISGSGWGLDRYEEGNMPRISAVISTIALFVQTHCFDCLMPVCSYWWWPEGQGQGWL